MHDDEQHDEPEAHARRDDPETSHEAARSVRNIRESQMAIADLMRHVGRPISDTEIGAIYGAWRAEGGDAMPAQSPSGLRTRRSELVELGVVEDSGQRERLPSKRWAILWQIKPGLSDADRVRLVENGPAEKRKRKERNPMGKTEEVNFKWNGLDVTAEVYVEDDDDVTPGSAEVEKLEATIGAVDVPDELIEHLYDELCEAALEAMR